LSFSLSVASAVKTLHYLEEINALSNYTRTLSRINNIINTYVRTYTDAHTYTHTFVYIVKYIIRGNLGKTG